jgi:hypothetical protein
MSIKTTDGRTVQFDKGQTYTKVDTVSGYVYTNVTINGQTFAGPTVTASEWAKIVKAQRLIAKFREADSKAYRLYKESRYMAVNHGDWNKIDRLCDSMRRWEVKRDAAAVALADLEVTA